MNKTFIFFQKLELKKANVAVQNIFYCTRNGYTLNKIKNKNMLLKKKNMKYATVRDGSKDIFVKRRRAIYFTKCADLAFL